MLTYNEIPAGVTEILQRIESVETLLQQLTGNGKQLQADEYITRIQAKDILHITLPTLLKHTLEGKLKGYRIGRRVLYKKNEVENAAKAISTK